MDNLNVSVDRMSKKEILCAAYALSQQIAQLAVEDNPARQPTLLDNGRLVAMLITEVARRDGIAVRPSAG
jgi:hypothetical protein